jgi:hypothetical protein
MRLRPVLAVVLTAGLLAAANSADPAFGDEDGPSTVLVSKAPDGTVGDQQSGRSQDNGNTSRQGRGALSRDGRFGVFVSQAANLVGGDTNGFVDIFVYDALSASVQRVSVSNSGEQANAPSDDPSISGDGRFVVFQSRADNLVPDDTNGAQDVFLHDLVTHRTERVSTSSTAEQGDLESWNAVVSDGGRYVAFASRSQNFTGFEGPSGWAPSQVVLKDRLTGTLELVSVAADGGDPSGWAFEPDITPDGRYVTFGSWSSNLVVGGDNGRNIYIRDRQSGQTELVSVSSTGAHGNSGSYEARVSADGRYVTFITSATNLSDVEDLSGQTYDILLRDRITRTTQTVSVTNSGRPARYYSDDASISDSGRFISFYSSDDLAQDGAGGGVFVHDRGRKTTTRASIKADGTPAGTYGYLSQSISGDGRLVLFAVEGTALDPADTNGVGDIYLRDRGDAAVRDSAPPVSTAIPTAVGSTSGSWTAGHWTVQTSCIDDLGNCTVHATLDGATLELVDGAVTVDREGRHHIDYWAVDSAGNAEQSHRLELIVDRGAPKVANETKDGAVFVYGLNQPVLEARAIDRKLADGTPGIGVGQVCFEITRLRLDGTNGSLGCVAAAPTSAGSQLWRLTADLEVGRYAVRAVARDLLGWASPPSAAVTITVVRSP